MFFVELQRYLVAPSERLASLALGIITAGLLLGMFIFSVIAATIVSAALDRELRGWRYFAVSRPVWRIYAAYLRCLLLGTGLVCAYAGAISTSALMQMPIGLLIHVLFGIGLALLAARCIFLAAPIACATTDGPIIRTAWSLSYGAFWQILSMIILGLAIAYSVQHTGEIIAVVGARANIRTSQFSIPLIEAYRALLAPVVAVQTISSTVLVLTLLPASAGLYRQLVTS